MSGDRYPDTPEDVINGLIDAGGSAFPVTMPGGHHFSGMSLRDWFAGQALAGMLSHGQGPNTAWHDHLPSAAEWAYEFADAMIAARSL